MGGRNVFCFVFALEAISRKAARLCRLAKEIPLLLFLIQQEFPELSFTLFCSKRPTEVSALRQTVKNDFRTHLYLTPAFPESRFPCVFILSYIKKDVNIFFINLQDIFKTNYLTNNKNTINNTRLTHCKKTVSS